jgi:hypothetical protein
MSTRETRYDAPAKRQITEETIPMKLTWHGKNGLSGYLTGENSTQGGDR